MVRVTRRRKGRERVPLSFAREALGISQAELARRMRTDQGEVSRIERRPDVLVGTLQRYAAALGARCEITLVLESGHRIPVGLPDDEPPR